MEMETGRKKIVKNEEPTSNSHSGLATKLLHLWSSGLLSAVLVRELADLALQEHAELIKLAEAGAWGAHTGNAHIQIMRKFWSDVKLPEPFTLKVRCVCVCVSKVSFGKGGPGCHLLATPYVLPFGGALLVLEKASWKIFGKVWQPLVMIGLLVTPCLWKSTGSRRQYHCFSMVMELNSKPETHRLSSHGVTSWGT